MPFLLLCLFYVYHCLTCICDCAPHVYSTCAGQMMALDPPDLEFLMVVSSYVGTET